MKKAFLFLTIFVLLFCFPSVSTALAETNNNSIRLLRITSGQYNSFVYLFPINSLEFENVEVGDIEIEGFKYFLKSRIDILSESYKTKAEGVEGVNVSDVKYYSEYDAIGFELNFENLSAYNKFFESDSEDSGDDTKKEQSGFFVTKTSYEVNFPFQVNTVETFSLLYSVTLSSWAETFSIDVQKSDYLRQVFENMIYVYEIASTQKGIYSDNMYQSGGIYYNVFEKTKAEISDNAKITFWTQSINKGWWYFFALVLTLIATISALIWIKIKNKKKISN